MRNLATIVGKSNRNRESPRYRRLPTVLRKCDLDKSWFVLPRLRSPCGERSLWSCSRRWKQKRQVLPYLRSIGRCLWIYTRDVPAWFPARIVRNRDILGNASAFPGDGFRVIVAGTGSSRFVSFLGTGRWGWTTPPEGHCRSWRVVSVHRVSGSESPARSPRFAFWRFRHSVAFRSGDSIPFAARTFGSRRSLRCPRVCGNRFPVSWLSFWHPVLPRVLTGRYGENLRHTRASRIVCFFPVALPDEYPDAPSSRSGARLRNSRPTRPGVATTLPSETWSRRDSANRKKSCSGYCNPAVYFGDNRFVGETRWRKKATRRRLSVGQPSEFSSNPVTSEKRQSCFSVRKSWVFGWYVRK